MEWDHDEWIEALRGFLGDDSEELDEEILIFVSNLAAKIAKGKITLAEAHRKIREFVAKKMGYVDLPDGEAFRLETEFHDLIDVTERTKKNLLDVGQPGIADALVQVYAHPNLVVDDTHVASVDENDIGSTAIALQSKGWFSVNGLHPAEHRDLTWAIVAALRQHAEAN